MILPETEKKLIPWARDVIDQCRVSCGIRARQAQSWRQWYYNGSDTGEAAIYNKIGPHIDRLASYLFSSADLRFSMKFRAHYPKKILQQGEVGARVLTDEFDDSGSGVVFGEGVKDALKYGSSIAKGKFDYSGATMVLVNPWQFGVYREDINDIERQEALCETSYITTHDLWRRISHLPGAYDMFRRAKSHAKRDALPESEAPYINQVILAGTQPVIQTANFTTQPGGLAVISADPGGAVLGPQAADEILPLHELWVVDDKYGDYTMLQLVEPDILIAGRFKRTNPLVPRRQPYRLIQPNMVNGYFWGRSEIADLMKLQSLLRDRLDDVKKIMSMQYDRLLAFVGVEGMTDEMYDQFREAGYIGLPPGANDVKDLTPKLPDNAFQDIDVIIRFMDEVSGFAPILNGGGEPGVRAGNHAQTLIKTASPRLRDRALLVEGQCAGTGGLMFDLLAAKDAKAYWPDENGNAEDFLLAQLPEDRRILVDSHSSSPIYQDDHLNSIALLAKLQVIGGDSIIDLMPDLPMRDTLKARYKELQQQRSAAAQREEQLRLAGAKAPRRSGAKT